MASWWFQSWMHAVLPVPVPQLCQSQQLRCAVVHVCAIFLSTADTVKVLLQSQSSVNPVYSGMVDATKRTIQTDGVSGLYKGVASPLAGTLTL